MPDPGLLKVHDHLQRLEGLLVAAAGQPAAQLRHGFGDGVLPILLAAGGVARRVGHVRLAPEAVGLLGDGCSGRGVHGDTPERESDSMYIYAPASGKSTAKV